MDPVEQVLETLQRLSEQPSPSATDDQCPISIVDVDSARRCLALSMQEEDLGLWQAVGRDAVSMVAVTKSLGDLMASGGHDCNAAAFYACLLRLPGCPVSV